MTLKTILSTLSYCSFIWIVGAQATGDTIFRDTFDDGDAADGMPVTWVPQAGTWTASSGDYTVSGPGRKGSLVPEHILGDTSVRTRVRLSGEGSPGPGVSIQFRRQQENIEFGYVGSLLADGTIGFARVAPFTILGVARAPFGVLNQDVMLQLDAIGDELSLWAWPASEPMPANPQVVVNDDTYKEGIVGVLSNETESTFRFVHVADTHIPYVSGDFDEDTLLTVADIDLLTVKVIEGLHPLKFDLNNDGVADQADRRVWIEELKKTYFGDSNLDGEFNSGDLVEVFKAGTYELDVDAGWAEGDWNGNQRFDSGDLVEAFKDGGYEQGPRSATNTVPEPSCAVLIAIGVIGLFRFRESR